MRIKSFVPQIGSFFTPIFLAKIDFIWCKKDSIWGTNDFIWGTEKFLPVLYSQKYLNPKSCMRFISEYIHKGIL